MGSLRRGLSRYNISYVTGGIYVGDLGGYSTKGGFNDRDYKVYRT